MKKSNVILIGYMGCGKTTLGKKLAKTLDFNFIDSDKKIEEAFNTTISELFETLGEEKFRTLEALFINSFESENTVLATGGGLPCFNQNIDVLKQKGLVVYLDRPAKELAHRLSNAKTTRPLLADKTESELLVFIEQQLAERLPYYQQADLILNRDEQEISTLTKTIKTLL